MPIQNPRAFISHSSQDRAFVEKFAADLRANGVDAWYSGWEIKPGDSIRARLDEGLAECEIFIIVLSKASINRPWVQTELDAATVRKLDGKVQKIIPIKIDECGELPPTLGALLWQDFSKEPYKVAFNGVLNSIFRVETKPPLGSIPDLPPLVASRTTKVSATTAIFWTAVAVAVVLIASKLTINIGMPSWIGQMAAGGILAGIVWKFFERVEALLTDNTKLEIAVWLLGRKKFGPKVQPWPETFALVFDRAFGKTHLSWRCFRRSALASTATVILVQTILLTTPTSPLPFSRRFPVALYLMIGASIANLLPDYLSLLQTRFSIGLIAGDSGSSTVARILVGNALLTALLGLVGTLMVESTMLIVPAHLPEQQYWTRLVEFELTEVIPRSAESALRQGFHLTGTRVGYVSLYPAFFTSIWLWLYAGSGFLLKAAHRFDIGFDWFNRKFDIEKKPLQSIGLVAGAMVAMVYWAVVIVGRVVG